MLRRAEMLSVIGDHLIQQGIPDRFLALIMLIDAGLHEPERCTQFTDVCACIAVLRKHFQRSGKDPLFRVVRHHNLPGQQVTFRSLIIVNERSLVKLFFLFGFPVRESFFQECDDRVLKLSSVFPFPVGHFRQILSVLVDILFVLHQLIAHLLIKIRAAVA